MLERQATQFRIDYTLKPRLRLRAHVVASKSPKPSKKPLYHKAFTDYVASKGSLPEIATRYGLMPDVLIRLAEAQKWEHRRSLLAGESRISATESRLHAQAHVDSTLCTATESIASRLADAYVSLITGITSLPVEPYADATALGEPPMTEQERYRQHCQMIERKVGLQRQATEGLREMIETAQAVGLLLVAPGSRKGGDDQDKPIDLSKLTQLNVAIVAATAGRPAQVMVQLGSEATGQGDLRNVTPSEPKA